MMLNARFFCDIPGHDHAGDAGLHQPAGDSGAVADGIKAPDGGLELFTDRDLGGIELHLDAIKQGVFGIQARRDLMPDSVERDVNSVAKDASSTANADQENSRTAKSANSVRVTEESSKMCIRDRDYTD